MKTVLCNCDSVTVYCHSLFNLTSMLFIMKTKFQDPDELKSVTHQPFSLRTNQFLFNSDCTVESSCLIGFHCGPASF
uniref:Uncharacterized protein n=1 Tax=Anguilla anguilla TaxID=7936 RepID=A0A0E9X033_ANGAN